MDLIIYNSISNLGNVYIADDGNCRIRKVTASTGIITLIAGTGATGYSGDGGAATSGTLYYPHGVVLDALGTTTITALCRTVTQYSADLVIFLECHTNYYSISNRQRVHR